MTVRFPWKEGTDFKSGRVKAGILDGSSSVSLSVGFSLYFAGWYRASPVYKTENTAIGIRQADHVAPSIRKKLTLTSPTSGGRSVGIVHSLAQATEFSLNREWVPDRWIRTVSIVTETLIPSFPRLFEHLLPSVTFQKRNFRYCSICHFNEFPFFPYFICLGSSCYFSG
jgi:hypothetical protein